MGIKLDLTKQKIKDTIMERVFFQKLAKVRCIKYSPSASMRVDKTWLRFSITCFLKSSKAMS